MWKHYCLVSNYIINIWYKSSNLHWGEPLGFHFKFCFSICYKCSKTFWIFPCVQTKVAICERRHSKYSNPSVSFECKQNHLIWMFTSRYSLLLNLAVQHGVNYNVGSNTITTLGKKHVIMHGCQTLFWCCKLVIWCCEPMSCEFIAKGWSFVKN